MYMKEKILRRLRTKIKSAIQETKLVDTAYTVIRKEVKKSSVDVVNAVKIVCLAAIFVGGFSGSEKTTKAINFTYNEYHIVNHYYK